MFEVALSRIPDQYIVHSPPMTYGDGLLDEAGSHHSYRANMTKNKRMYNLAININQDGEHNWINLNKICQ